MALNCIGKIKKEDSSVKVCFLRALNELQSYEQYKKEVFPKLGERKILGAKPLEKEELLNRVNEKIKLVV